MSLHDRLRPWHGLMALTFFAGVGFSLGQAGPVAPNNVLFAVISGLVAVLLLQFTVGNVWGYAVEYANAGGSWTDAPFLAPFVAAVLVLVAVLFVNPGFAGTVVAAALWSAFWGFVVTAAVVAVVVRFATGYRAGRS